MFTAPPGSGHICSAVRRATLAQNCSDAPREYLTLDRWATRAAYEAFRARWSGEYHRLDARSEELTEEEALVGTFEALP